MGETKDLIMISIRETSERSGVPQRFIREKAKEGKCPGIYSGKKFLVNYNKFITMLNNNEL